MKEDVIVNYLDRHGLEAKTGSTILVERKTRNRKWYATLLGKNETEKIYLNFGKKEFVILPLVQDSMALIEGDYAQVPLLEVKSIYFKKQPNHYTLIIQYNDATADDDRIKKYKVPKEVADSPWHKQNLANLIERFGLKEPK
ncbi:hypothetical protein [Carnobacterium sp. ISL-102]|uniref:hypothetical protein n=1 Tax=Carnobacterium TaxID=2747 RepID=UPI001BE8C9C9|nr:hypothetical protein [Carnobacterium sp. ISL-102]MBT2732137.1 hypothetical protein [Carnobacterium sp. ISL-102]